jgi:hypothetical protein
MAGRWHTSKNQGTQRDLTAAILQLPSSGSAGAANTNVTGWWWYPMFMMVVLIALGASYLPEVAHESWSREARAVWYERQWTPRCESLLRKAAATLSRVNNLFDSAEITSSTGKSCPTCSDLAVTAQMHVRKGPHFAVFVTSNGGERTAGWTQPAVPMCSGECPEGSYFHTVFRTPYGRAEIEWESGLSRAFMRPVKAAANECIDLFRKRPWGSDPLPTTSLEDAGLVQP